MISRYIVKVHFVGGPFIKYKHSNLNLSEHNVYRKRKKDGTMVRMITKEKWLRYD
jgi:hypothetical protein